MDMNNIEKKSFSLDSFKFECGREIPLTLGYETYGEMNADKSNVILVCHYFSASSHAAGKYSESDAVAGYWDALIGPGKAVDTNKYFVISIDNVSNVQVKNPNVITTGPRSIDPKTNKRYGLDFPVYTFRDMARIQHEFLTKQLGINKLHAVMGASAGGFASSQWAVEFPDMVERYIGVISNVQNPMITNFSVIQHAMRAIKLDPNWNNGNYEDDAIPTDGFKLALQMMNVGAFSAELYEETYKRDSSDLTPLKDMDIVNSYEKQLDAVIDLSLAVCDASHWYYTCRATMMQDIALGYSSLEAALDRIQAKVLFVTCKEDMLQPSCFNHTTIDTLKKLNKDARLFEFSSLKGHMAGVFDTHLFEKEIKEFIEN